MMTQAEFLTSLARALERAEIAYMVTGSLGSALHGVQRATNDVDVVIDPTEKQLTAFLQSLGEEYYVSSAAAREAFRRRGMFNVIHTGSGHKADLIVRKDRPFSVQEFERRRQSVVAGVPICVLAAEDAILSKLEWCRLGESERQFRDALGVAIVQGAQLDVAYLRRWAAQLGVGDLLDRVLAEAANEDRRGPD